MEGRHVNHSKLVRQRNKSANGSKKPHKRVPKKQHNKHKQKSKPKTHIQLQKSQGIHTGVAGGGADGGDEQYGRCRQGRGMMRGRSD
jgi:hypothetical protein